MGGGLVRNILITGGAGFIGSNLAESLLRQEGTRVRILDNLSRAGVAHNVEWLRSHRHSDQFEFVQGDVRDLDTVVDAASDATEIYHLAAQVAVTTSVEDPGTDFAVNALGTFHVLEAARRSGRNPFLLFTSTNKVYGSLSSVPTVVEGTRHTAEDPTFQGVDETAPLDFHSPYGCSKGAADQYVRDYARIYDLPTVVFRMSCIAGPRQFGNEDQGWVAHFLYSTLAQRQISVYGDGLQVRDVLHVHDLVEAMHCARTLHASTHGHIYNMGGGMDRAISVLEAIQAIERETGVSPRLRYDLTRPGDQPLYISDTAKFERDTGWRPRRSVLQTIRAIHEFWRANHHTILALQNHTQMIRKAAAPAMEQEVA